MARETTNNNVTNDVTKISPRISVYKALKTTKIDSQFMYKNFCALLYGMCIKHKTILI